MAGTKNIILNKWMLGWVDVGRVQGRTPDTMVEHNDKFWYNSSLLYPLDPPPSQDGLWDQFCGKWHYSDTHWVIGTSNKKKMHKKCIKPVLAHKSKDWQFFSHFIWDEEVRVLRPAESPIIVWVVTLIADHFYMISSF